VKFPVTLASLQPRLCGFHCRGAFSRVTGAKFAATMLRRRQLVRSPSRTMSVNSPSSPTLFAPTMEPHTQPELGHLWVRQNRSCSSDRLIQVAFVRLKTAAPNPRSPVVFLPGGRGDVYPGRGESLELAQWEVGSGRKRLSRDAAFPGCAGGRSRIPGRFRCAVPDFAVPATCLPHHRQSNSRRSATSPLKSTRSDRAFVSKKSPSHPC
jgi:hypothetical protein